MEITLSRESRFENCDDVGENPTKFVHQYHVFDLFMISSLDQESVEAATSRRRGDKAKRTERGKRAKVSS